jgi:hypothetical protein
MNLTALDWLVLIVPVAVIGMIALKTRKYTRSVRRHRAGRSELRRRQHHRPV